MKKILSLILVVLMALVCMPVKEAFAEDEVETVIWTNGEERSVDWGDYNYSFTSGSFESSIWEKIKTDTFYMDFEKGENDETIYIRVTTGWWTKPDWPSLDVGDDHNVLIDDPLVTCTGDNKYTLEINFADHPIASIIDEQGLIFTGKNYVAKKIYFLSDEDYSFVSGDNFTFDFTQSEDKIIISNAKKKYFKNVQVNRNIIDNDNYEVEEDSNNTKITLKSSYLNGLYDGTYSLSIVFLNGQVDTTFIVANHPEPTPAPEPKHEILNTGVN